MSWRGRGKRKKKNDDEDDYILVRLQDVYSCVKLRVNFIAVVFECGLPKDTKGTDMCCILKLIDETHDQFPITVNIFNKHIHDLPRVFPGDIIHLRQVKLSRHMGIVNATFYKECSSFALYKGKNDDHDDDFVAYQYYPDQKLRDIDKVRIDILRKWLADFKILEDSSNFLMLREIQDGHHNLACKILHCWEGAKDTWFVYVWDGTDAPPTAISTILEDEVKSPLKLQHESLTLSRDILCTFPTIGSILRIMFEQPIEKNQLQVLNIGEWVKFVNIRFKHHGGIWFGKFDECSMLRYTPNEDSLILERQRLYHDRISLKSGTVSIGSIPQFIDSLPESLRITGNNLVRHVTLMDILTHSEVTARFKCVVRVVAALPYQVEKFCPPAGTYTLRLTLEDPTARIHAFVLDVEEFLIESNPGNVRRTWNKLLGVTECDDNVVLNDTPRNPPWISVCIKSYYVSKTDAWGTRNFSIFDTKIVGDPLI